MPTIDQDYKSRSMPLKEIRQNANHESQFHFAGNVILREADLK
tara:strand:+ start:1041 stop:1169 length:129 start_codon:yes stop_codon:yes gene_type:complete